MSNILVGVAYKGTNYSGWQRQDNALGIQEVIENAIYDTLGVKAEIFGSGRTDAGVHAIEQCFSVELNFKNVSKLPYALNTKLPTDIRILWAKEMPSDFHARFSAHTKTYVYKLKIAEFESPFDYDTTTYIDYNLNYDSMKKASEFLIGEHNFKSFCSAQTSVPDFVRTINYINITKNDNFFEFEVNGNGFLYNMVRIIVGTLVDVGRGKINVEDIPKIIQAEDRQKAGKTMDAKGLFLKKVTY